MGLETATYISQLVPSNPLGVDDRSQGDDHIRLIKQTLQNTFPNVNSAVTSTDEQLNKVAEDGVLCFPGMIVMWSGSTVSIPTGWKLCNGMGTTSTGSPVPDLRSRFIVGSATDSGGSFNIGDVGGSANIVVSGATNGHSLTVDQMPSHSHSTSVPRELFQRGSNAGLGDEVMDGISALPSSSVGGGQAHSHGLNITFMNANLPPFYALAFIIKN